MTPLIPHHPILQCGHLPVGESFLTANPNPSCSETLRRIRPGFLFSLKKGLTLWLGYKVAQRRGGKQGKES